MDEEGFKDITEFFAEEKQDTSSSENLQRYWELRLQEYQTYLNQRKLWAETIRMMLWIIMSANLIFLFFVGRNLLLYTDPWIPRIVFLGNFADIIGLAVILVSYLFPNGKKAITDGMAKQAPKDPTEIAFDGDFEQRKANN